jgi:hypothetical protein
MPMTAHCVLARALSGSLDEGGGGPFGIRFSCRRVAPRGSLKAYAKLRSLTIGQASLGWSFSAQIRPPKLGGMGSSRRSACPVTERTKPGTAACSAWHLKARVAGSPAIRDTICPDV